MREYSEDVFLWDWSLKLSDRLWCFCTADMTETFLKIVPLILRWENFSYPSQEHASKNLLFSFRWYKGGNSCDIFKKCRTLCWSVNHWIMWISDAFRSFQDRSELMLNWRLWRRSKKAEISGLSKHQFVSTLLGSSVIADIPFVRNHIVQRENLAQNLLRSNH